MYKYAIINNQGIITNITVKDDMEKDTADCVNIDDSPWLKIGDYIDTPNPENANAIINRRIDILDSMFRQIEAEQFRSVCQIMAAQLAGTDVDPKDKELFLEYETKKQILRKAYPITADGTSQEWIETVQQRMVNSLQNLYENL